MSALAAAHDPVRGRVPHFRGGTRVRPATREAEKSGVYSFERKEEAKLEPDTLRRFEKNAKAWKWFEGQAPWYRRTAFHWVVSAKKAETRGRRFEQLLEDSANGRRIAPLTSPKAKTSSADRA